MIGIFDSGVGGMSACKELRRLLPKSDIVYLADRKNAPYGTKTQDELIELVRTDIKRLRSMGAEQILAACCTASSVAELLGSDETVNFLPIIAPSAREAAKYSRITVIATDHTARTSAFGREIRKIAPSAEVQELPCQKLVALVEEGSRDGRVTGECMAELLRIRACALSHGAQGIILGCTHFSHLENTVGKLLQGVAVINPAKIGARTLAKKINVTSERGKTLYTE